MTECCVDSLDAKSFGDYSQDVREDLLLDDPLLGCLVELSRIYGNPTTRAALTVGLPLDKGKLTPSLFSRAASRVGLSSRVLRRSLTAIEDIVLPVVLILKGNQAVLLVGWNDLRDTAYLLLPETGPGKIEMSLTDLSQRYLGVAIFAKPRFLFDSRAPEAGNIAQRHWFWGAILAQGRIYRDVMFAALMINIFALVMPLFSMNVYDRVVPNNAIETLWVFSLGVALVYCLDFSVRVMRGYYIDLAGARIDLQLSGMLMGRLLGMRLEGRPASVGAFASNFRSFESVRDFIASSSITALIDLPFALIFLVVIGWISWPLVFIPIVGLVVGIIYSWLVQGKMHALSETSYRALALRNATLVESLSALDTIKAHGAEGVMQGKWESATAYVTKIGARTRLLSSTAVNGASVIAQVVNVALIVAGVYLIQERELSMGGLIAVTMLGSRAMSPLGQMVGMLLQYQGARVSLGTIDKLIQLPSERSEGSSFVHRAKLLGGIEFRNVTFNYPGHTDAVLNNVSFRISPGEHVVILGSIGSGKSTLQKLILGLYQPSAGVIRIDGVDQRQLDPADLRRNIGFVGQEVTLFFGTLRENITIGAPCAEDSMVLGAIEVAGLTQFVDRHPKGIDMPIGERGDSLSGGQRQSVALARAVLMNPPILVFDEPTSAMDFSAENKFKASMKRFAENKTMLIVTHRSSLVDMATRIIIVDEGQVVADGPREEVIRALKEGRVRKVKQ